LTRPLPAVNLASFTFAKRAFDPLGLTGRLAAFFLMTALTVPKRSAIVLVGASGSGKTTFARRHFLRTQIISSDECRALLTDDENHQECSGDAFNLVYWLAETRMKRDKLTVLDSTAVEKFARERLLEIANARNFRKVVVIFDIPEELCVTRDAEREGRTVGPEVIAQQKREMAEALRNIPNEGWDEIINITPDIQEALRINIVE
jgi:protein phosphatase